MNESQRDRLGGILRNPVPIELLDIAERRTDPVEAGIVRLALVHGGQGDS
jgi:hypothetical protein